MFSLIKMIVGAAMFGIVAYAFFFVNLGGQSLAGHVADVWRTPVVQDKVDQVRDGLKQELEERLAEAGRKAGEEAGRKLARAATEDNDDELTDDDREALADLIEQSAKTP